MPKASTTWACGANGPQTVPELRVAMAKLVKSKNGKKLISEKFENDHMFPGHSKNPAVKLASVRGTKKSTYVGDSIVANAQKEVANWIKNFSAACMTYNNGTWTVANAGNTVKSNNMYTFTTVDFDERKKLDSDDVKKKSRKWLSDVTVKPKVACRFDSDGTPLIYHLDY